MALIILDANLETLFEAMLVSLTIEGAVTTTDQKVESGISPTDHAEVMPEEWRATVAISDTPLTGAALAGASTQAYDTLDQLRRNPQLISVITSRRSMLRGLVTQVSAPYTDRTGRGILIDLSIKEIRVVQTIATQVPATILAEGRRASAKSKDKKQDQSKDETAKEGQARTKSLAKGLADLVRPSF